MNRQEWYEKFVTYDELMDNMIMAIPNFHRHKENYVIKKTVKYYSIINTVSLKILENRKMPYMKLSTYSLENKVEESRELLKKELEKRGMENIWDQELPNIKGD